MITKAKQALTGLQRRWQFLLLAKALIFAAGPALLAFFIFNLFWAILVFLVIFSVFLLIEKPWTIHLEQVSSYVDEKIDSVSFSSYLVLQSTAQLSGLAQLQQERTAGILTEKMGKIRPKIGFLWPFLSLFICFLVSFLVVQFDLKNSFFFKEKPGTIEEKIRFVSLDSASVKIEPPVLQDQKLTITYPAYTNKAPFSTSTMNVQAVEGSRLQWSLQFDQPVDSVSIEFSEVRSAMHFKNGRYVHAKIPDGSGFYNFQFNDSLGGAYLSELYSVEMLTDQAPTAVVNGLQPYRSFQYDDTKTLHFNTQITDDYGIGEAHIIATVSRGTGESVKFREDRLLFDTSVNPGGKSWKLAKTINLDSLKMEPGDELYFYVQVADLKTPKANTARSETFFAVVEDTVSYDFAVEGTMGVDQMPDYFRSQRQLIIDTEKLLKNKPTLSNEAFNSASNELGIEQSALRLKYGKFMGDENSEGEAHEHEGNENPIADYMHDHDGSNEHNLVEKDSEQAQKDTTSAGTPDQFTQSLHSKMRVALNEMWDSERHLRISEPQQSLPYQLRALELLQQIKNSARIYVHRIGFDPPPIKENTRLSGDLQDVQNYRETEDLTKPESTPFMRKAVALLEQLIVENKPIFQETKTIFRKAGNELAQRSIDEPGKYLQSLQHLKLLTQTQNKPDEEMLRQLQTGLLQALETPRNTPDKGEETHSDLNALMLKEMDKND